MKYRKAGESRWVEGGRRVTRKDKFSGQDNDTTNNSHKHHIDKISTFEQLNKATGTHADITNKQSGQSRLPMSLMFAKLERRCANLLFCDICSKA